MSEDELREVDELIGEAAEHMANGDLLASVVAQARLGERASLLRHEVHRLRAALAYYAAPELWTFEPQPGLPTWLGAGVTSGGRLRSGHEHAASVLAGGPLAPDDHAYDGQ